MLISGLGAILHAEWHSLLFAQHQLMHHAASSLPSTRESIPGGRKPSRKSAAFDAALAARTTARLCAREAEPLSETNVNASAKRSP